MFEFHDAVQKAVRAVREDGMPHADALREFLPEYAVPDVINYMDTGAGADTGAGGAFPFRAAVFNMERGTFLRQILVYFASHPLLRRADVVFANELDWGMARTGNEYTARAFALALGYNAAFGIEFVTESAWLDGNGRGLHGNAVFSRFPLDQVCVVSLPVKYDWFYKEGDCRLGTRNAVLARAKTPAGYVGLVSAHLENRTTPQGRAEQAAFLLDAVEAHFGNLPVLIGGDLNTNTVDGNRDEDMRLLAESPEEMLRRLGETAEREPLLDYAASRGFSWKDCNIAAKQTRRKPMDDGTTVMLNLDWFLQRGLRCSAPARVESIFHNNGLVDPPPEALEFQGQELSDHDIVMVTCGGLDD